MKMAEALHACTNREKIQKWASKNAFTLIFLSFMFFVTWTLLVVSIWTGYHRG